MSGECSEHTLDCICSLEKSIEYGWTHCQPHNRPDESFRAMLIVMKHWHKYMEDYKKEILSKR